MVTLKDIEKLPGRLLSTRKVLLHVHTTSEGRAWAAFRAGSAHMLSEGGEAPYTGKPDPHVKACRGAQVTLLVTGSHVIPVPGGRAEVEALAKGMCCDRSPEGTLLLLGQGQLEDILSSLEGHKLWISDLSLRRTPAGLTSDVAWQTLRAPARSVSPELMTHQRIAAGELLMRRLWGFSAWTVPILVTLILLASAKIDARVRELGMRQALMQRNDSLATQDQRQRDKAVTWYRHRRAITGDLVGLLRLAGDDARFTGIHAYPHRSDGTGSPPAPNDSLWTLQARSTDPAGSGRLAADCGRLPFVGATRLREVRIGKDGLYHLELELILR